MAVNARTKVPAADVPPAELADYLLREWGHVVAQRSLREVGMLAQRTARHLRDRRFRTAARIYDRQAAEYYRLADEVPFRTLETGRSA